jgi:sterol 3beta-glucosyltransferase
MRIAVVCNDTRGGVQPYAALAAGLVRAGHDVRAVAPEEFGAMFAGIGVPMSPLSGGEMAAAVRATGIAERGAVATMRLMARELPRQINQWTRETLAACEGVELITGGIGGMVIGLAVAEKLGVPFIETQLQPVGVSTGEYPGVMLPWVPSFLGSDALRLSHRLSDRAVWMAFKGPMAKARADVLGLTGPTRGSAPPFLYGFSPHVLRVARDKHDHRVRVATGYWNLPPWAGAWSPPPGLERFLARPGPVVSIGFGSMASGDPAEVTRLVGDAVGQAGVRAVLMSGWGGLAPAGGSPDLFTADAIPHDWLFPRLSAVVHHGGAGTTGAGFQAGVPQLVVPFSVDQPFWGARVAALGCGPAPIPRKRLTAARLAAGIRTILDDTGYAARAAALGRHIRMEDGVAKAVGYFARLA